MKKVFLLIFLLGIFVSCHETNGIVSTTKMELRQLVSKEVITKNSSGFFFVIMGGYSSSEQRQDVIKMFVKVDNSYYKLLKLNLEDVNVIIDNKISKPYLIVVKSSNWKETDEEILQYIGYAHKIYLHCPEKYLPEKLLSIELN
jgi:hypothetical protein